MSFLLFKRLAQLVAILLLAKSASAITPWSLTINTNNILVVTNATYGAAGDGVATNTSAIQNAINAATLGGTTNGLSGGTVEIPSGIYLSGPLTLKSSVNLQIDAGAILRMLPIDKYPIVVTTNITASYVTNLSLITTNFTTNFTWTAANFISASGLTNIAIIGPGAIDGQGLPWWPYAYTNGFNRPTMLSLNSNNRQLIQNITLSNSPMFHIAAAGAVNTTVKGVTIRAPSSSANPPSHNTDACDVSGSNTLVQDCDISVGDDDFTCGGNTSDVLLTNNIYGSGHGLSIGSYTDGGVQNITVINCTFNGTDNGIRIKSDNNLYGTSKGGLVQNINYFNLGMTNVHFPIQIYAYYNLIGTPSGISPNYAATQAVAAVTSYTPIYRNITFSNINATSVSGYPIGIVWARTEMPATNIVFNKVNVTGNRSFDLYNVNGAQFIDCNLKPSAASNTFALFNAQVIITNSTPTNTLFSFSGLVTNGYGNSYAFYNALGSLSNTNAFDDGPLTLSASTLTVSNNLTLFPTTALNYVLGSNAATLAVKGNLTLGGTNHFSAGSGFGLGTNILMTYTGSLNGVLPVISSVPYAYTFAYDTSAAGLVRLIVTTNLLAVPLAPTNLVATATNQLVSLNWSPAATATSYNVKRATTSGGAYTTLANVAVTNYFDPTVANGTTYFYVVSAINGGGEGTNSTEVSATPTVPLVFSENFSFSTVNSTPSAPSVAGTSYEIISAKGWNPAPSIGSGNFIFGIGATTSGSIEVQALFTVTPVTLTTVGDAISLTVSFTNVSGLLTQSGALGFGLYHSGQNYPVSGGMNGSETGAASPNATGNAQTWLGYFAQLAFTGANSPILTRPAQTGANNNNQDLVTTGGSPSFNSPSGSTVGTASSAPSVTLTAGNPYTEVLAIKLTATNTLAITNRFYAGTGTNGTLLSQFGGAASAGTFLTNSFDALAIGWRATANTSATTIDINQISVSAAVAPPVLLVPTNLVALVVGNQLQLSWPADHLGWRLQIQTNNLSSGLGTNWATVGNSTNVTAANIAIDPNNGAVFLRLVYP